MDSNNSQLCMEMKSYINDTLRADVYLVLAWKRFLDYLSPRYSEDDVKACLPYLGIEVYNDVVFLWAGEYYNHLIKALVDMVRREGDVSVIAELYREGAL
jgi:hypothetical protein